MSDCYGFFRFSQTEFNWNWQELLYGVENKIIARSDIADYVTRILGDGILGFDLVLKIAIADENEDILPYIHSLINLEDSEDSSMIQDKWRYALLKVLYAKKANYADLSGKVEEIYADFDYPEDMAGFIRYMPSVGGRSMEESWQEYLTSSEIKFENK